MTRIEASQKIMRYNSDCRSAIDNIKNEEKAANCLRALNNKIDSMLETLDFLFPTGKIDGESN